MDVKVSQKIPRYQPDGVTEVLVSDVFDLYPVFSTSDPRAINNLEMLNDDEAERLDRGLFACIKQRGLDPIDMDDGVQWEEALAEEISVSTLIQQIQNAVQETGSGVDVEFYTIVSEQSVETLSYKLTLTDV